MLTGNYITFSFDVLNDLRLYISVLGTRQSYTDENYQSEYVSRLM